MIHTCSLILGFLASLPTPSVAVNAPGAFVGCMAQEIFLGYYLLSNSIIQGLTSIPSRAACEVSTRLCPHALHPYHHNVPLLARPYLHLRTMVCPELTRSAHD